MLRIADSYSVPITFFVEALEFMAMEKVAETASWTNMVIEQLKQALKKVHDVQLHLHPQFEQTTWDGEKWRIGDLDKESISKLLKNGKNWIESTLKVGTPEYQCIAFRAGGWCIQPSATLVNVLLQEGFKVDSTVAESYVNLVEREWADFRNVPEKAFWRAADYVCCEGQAHLREVSIVTGRISRWQHFNAVRMSRQGENGGLAPGCMGNYGASSDNLLQKLHAIVGKALRLGHAMLDVSTMPVDVLIEIAEQWIRRFGIAESPIPLVAIAHTKNFTAALERNMSEYLAWAKNEGMIFSTYGQWLEAIDG